MKDGVYDDARGCLFPMWEAQRWNIIETGGPVFLSFRLVRHLGIGLSLCVDLGCPLPVAHGTRDGAILASPECFGLEEHIGYVGAETLGSEAAVSDTKTVCLVDQVGYGQECEGGNTG